MVILLFVFFFSQVHGFSNGGLDTSFNPTPPHTFPGLPGVETILPLTDYGATATFAFAQSVVIDANGKIVAAGGADGDGSGHQSMTIVRLNDDGSLDTTLNPAPAHAFPGVPGIETIWTASFGAGTTTVQAGGIGLLSDGRIAVGGFSIGSPAGSVAFAAVLLHGADGSLDTSFNPSPANVFPGVPGVESVWTVSFGAGATGANAFGLAVQANNMLVLAGNANPMAAGGFSLAVARLTTTGALDPNFNAGHVLVGGPGTATIPLANFGVGATNAEANAVAIQQDQKIVAVGTLNGNAAMIAVRLTTTGGLDDTFGGIGGATAGITVLPPAVFGVGATNTEAFGVAIQPDGKIVLVGLANPGLDTFAIARLTTAGALDTTFNGNGTVVIPLTAFDPGATAAEANAVQIQSDGKIVVGGVVTISGTFNSAVVRLDTNGILDPTFVPSTNETGSPGAVVIPVTTSQSSMTNEVNLSGLALDAQQRIVLAGDADPGGNEAFFFARLGMGITPAPTGPKSCIAQAIIAKYCS